MVMSETVKDHPSTRYRERFFESVMGDAPGSILDVGCGDGAFLRRARERGCKVAGLEPDPGHLAALSQVGIPAQQGHAETLPFGDGAFDGVVFEYVAHHCADLARALVEAVRVARRGVYLLDAWYDETIASQRSALVFDRWSKSIDRRLGMVHNACPTATELMACLSGSGDLTIDYAQMLILKDMTVDALRAAGTEQLARVANDPTDAAALDSILDEARRVGVTEDGALIMAIRKR
jgi:SAM-dependent methyltransferase